MQTFNTVSSSEIITPQLIREWRHDNTMMIYTLSSPERDHILDFADANIETIAAWSPEQVMYTVQDISAPGMGLTEYFRNRLTDIVDASIEANVRIISAMILPDTLMYRIFALFGQKLVKRSGGRITQQYFTDRAQGIAWVESQLRAEPYTD